MTHDVYQRVLTVVCDVLDCKQDEVAMDASLRSNFQIDSLKQMTLFIALEDEFQRTIPPEQVTELDTLKEIVEFIQKKLQEPTAV